MTLTGCRDLVRGALRMTDGDDTDEYLYKVLVVGEVRVRVWCIIGIYQAHPLVYS